MYCSINKTSTDLHLNLTAEQDTYLEVKLKFGNNGVSLQQFVASLLNEPSERATSGGVVSTCFTYRPKDTNQEFHAHRFNIRIITHVILTTVLQYNCLTPPCFGGKQIITS